MKAWLLFCLLVGGQFYPFSLVWAQSRQGHPCCCAGTLKVCDCNHSSSRRFRCHQERADGYAPLACGQKTAPHALPNFQGEPYLVILQDDHRPANMDSMILQPGFSLVKFLNPPESPPPKGNSPEGNLPKA